MDQAAATIGQLEKQLAELQAMMVAAQESKANIVKEMAPHQQALDAVMQKLQQAQADLTSISSQQQLFEQSYKK
jgi:chromosome segregation ATPase